MNLVYFLQAYGNKMVSQILRQTPAGGSAAEVDHLPCFCHTGSEQAFQSNWKCWYCHKPSIHLQHGVCPEAGRAYLPDHLLLKQIIHCFWVKLYFHHKDAYGSDAIFQNGMDKWQQSLNDYTSVPVYFDRSIMGENIMERNGVKGSCSFATVRTAEEIQKEIDDRVKAAEKNGPTLRETLANAFPNAVNTLYSFVGSSVVMTFDEYVKAMEEMLRKSNEEANVSLIK